MAGPAKEHAVTLGDVRTAFILTQGVGMRSIKYFQFLPRLQVFPPFQASVSCPPCPKYVARSTTQLTSFAAYTPHSPRPCSDARGFHFPASPPPPQAGRVNGNLNLSRSIGDLKYKANTELPPADQMITAEPDLKSVEVTDEDRFMILACDGVWDCMTSQEVGYKSIARAMRVKCEAANERALPLYSVLLPTRLRGSVLLSPQVSSYCTLLGVLYVGVGSVSKRTACFSVGLDSVLACPVCVLRVDCMYSQYARYDVTRGSHKPKPLSHVRLSLMPCYSIL